jgi:adenosylhomocysteinase
VDPTRALEAVMDGYEVMPMAAAAAVGDVFITATGDKGVLAQPHFEKMKDGAVLANSGHFNVEIDIPALERLSASRRIMRDFVEEYRMADGRRIYLLADGRLVNLSAAEGHPASVMDMSFANQALCVEHLVKNYTKLEKKVYSVPEEIDRAVAQIKLEAMGVRIDRLSAEQSKYLSSWSEGT